jgi:hypothetical protein
MKANSQLRLPLEVKTKETSSENERNKPAWRTPRNNHRYTIHQE